MNVHTLSRCIAAVLVLFALSAAAPGRTYTNPLKSVKGADPWIQFHDGNYYMISHVVDLELTMRKSPTLAGLSTAPTVQVYRETAADRCCNIWAPEMHYLNGRWYLYYTAGRGGNDYDSQRLHVLESAGADPLGPYTYKNRIQGTNATGWLIDGSILRVGSQLYVIASAFTTATQNLVIAPLSNPWTVSGAFSTISTPTLAWERQGGDVNEAPAALYRNGRTMIVYSASACWGPDYKLGLLTLTGSNPLSQSSWTKGGNPVFQRSDANSVYGPGHHGIFSSPDGTESWIVYHANDGANEGCDNNRTTRAQKFTFNSDNTPDFGTPLRLGASAAGPAGETAQTPTAYRLVNRNSGKCLDLADASAADGANVRQWTCNGATAQQWRIQDQGDDTNRLVNVASGKVLDVADCSGADGADIRQWSWLNNTCQRFRLIYTATGGWVRIVNAATGKVADVTNCGTGDGNDVRQWSWLNNNCQQWQIQAV